MANYNFSRHELCFLEAIHESPRDDTPRLIYADWLDDQGQAEYAEFIRYDCRTAHVASVDFTDEMLAFDTAIRDKASDNGSFYEWAKPYPNQDYRPKYERGLPLFNLGRGRPANELLQMIDSCSPRMRFLIIVHANVLTSIAPIIATRRVNKIIFWPEYWPRSEQTNTASRIIPITTEQIETLASLPYLQTVEHISMTNRGYNITDAAWIRCQEVLSPLCSISFVPEIPR